MMLAAGARLGGYEVLSHLGSGGMGEVYRARDTKLGRDVAIKILPDGFAHDPDRLARFKREAQVLASLNHPHIGAIYGLEESASPGSGQQGAQYLVLEFVDGETLADRIAAQRATGRGLPVAEALAIARQIADALEVAHEKGIIHRDLKPANIALTAADEVKVLDFGLAKALDGGGIGEANVTHSPTLTLHATHAGVILGTAAYMSPEQAKGRIADKRSDVWSFGCVLFEMLAGTRAFEGEDVSDTLATILKGEPEWSRIPHDVPASIRSLLSRCLEKDRKQRIADISVARYVLSAPLETAAPTRAPAGTAKPRSSWIGFTAAIAAVLIAAAGGWILKPSPAVSVRPITRFPIILAQDQSFTSFGRHILALSPDGTRLVYVANSQLYLRAMDQVDASPIRGTSESPAEPFFSPDGQWIAYYADGHLKKVAISGGAPTTLCDAQVPWGASWDGDRIVFGEGPRGIFEVAATGGTPKLLVAADAKQSEFLHGPQILPGGQAVLFTSGSPGVVASRWSNATIVVQSLKTGERKTLVSGGTDGRYLPTGHLVFARDGVLFANAFDAARLELRGGPAAVVEGVAVASGGATGAVQVAFSNTGTLAYPPVMAGQATKLVWRNRQGLDTPIAAPQHSYETPRVSPDGTRIAMHALDQDSDIWVLDTKSEALTRLTFDKAADMSPVWTKDGRRVAYVSAKDGAPNLFWKPADGTGQSEPLLAQPPSSSGALIANGATPDGKALIFSVGVPSNIMTLPFEGDRQPRALIAQPSFAERSGDVSPDGRWIAYQSDESGTFQIYVRPFPAVDQGRWQVSGEGGRLPIWGPNGRELFYTDDRNRLVSVNVSAATPFAFGKASVVFDLADTLLAVYRNYDIAPDGSRFALIKPERQRGSTQFLIVENWFEELKQRVPVGR